MVKRKEIKIHLKQKWNKCDFLLVWIKSAMSDCFFESFSRILFISILNSNYYWQMCSNFVLLIDVNLESIPIRCHKTHLLAPNAHYDHVKYRYKLHSNDFVPVFNYYCSAFAFQIQFQLVTFSVTGKEELIDLKMPWHGITIYVNRITFDSFGLVTQKNTYSLFRISNPHTYLLSSYSELNANTT